MEAGEHAPLLYPAPKAGGGAESTTTTTNKISARNRNTITSWVAALAAFAVVSCMLAAAIVTIDTHVAAAGEDGSLTAAEFLARFEPADDVAWAGLLPSTCRPISTFCTTQYLLLMFFVFFPSAPHRTRKSYCSWRVALITLT
jgi:hypothetical protein